MPPSAQALFGLMAMSLLAWSIIVWVHVLPWLARLSRREALLFLVVPHMFRHVGALALFPGIGAAPPEWSVPLAWGDCITALLAAASMIALQRSWRFAIPLTWVFNVFGILDLLHNGFNAAVLQVAPHLGPIAYVVGILVPGMLLIHLLIFRTLWRSA